MAAAATIRILTFAFLKLPERGTHERTLMLGCVIALRYLGRLGVTRRHRPTAGLGLLYR